MWRAKLEGTDKSEENLVHTLSTNRVKSNNVQANTSANIP